MKDHFAILKVGPALTFALREAIFALAKIEQELIFPEDQSQVLAVIDQVMLDEPGYWKNITALNSLRRWSIFITVSLTVSVITGQMPDQCRSR